MQKTLAEIAKIVKGEVVGDAGLIITGISGIKEAKKGDLTFVANPKYTALIKETKASAVIISREMQISGKSAIRTDNPSLAFANIINSVYKEEFFVALGVHPQAVVSKKAKIGKNVAVGACCVIEDKVEIGDDTVIYPLTYLGYNSKVGKKCLIYPHVTIRECVILGDRVIIHAGTVIGSDGFGFAEVKGVHEKIPQTGTVVIEDDVEIGANVTIDRARFEKTVIGKGTKIDNLVQIAHNVEVGKHCIIVSQAGISGSTKIGNGAILAGQAGIVGHITIGDGAIVGAKSGVAKSIPANTKVFGYPALPHMEAKRVIAASHVLPDYIKRIQELEQKVKDLEKRLK